MIRLGIGTSRGISIRAPFSKSPATKSLMTQPIHRAILENSIKSSMSVATKS